MYVTDASCIYKIFRDLPFIYEQQLDHMSNFQFQPKINIKASKTSKYNMSRLWNAHSIYYLTVMRTIALHSTPVGALENYTKSNNIIKLKTEL